MGELTALIFLHAGLGVALALLVYASGLGALALLRGPGVLRGSDAVYSYPLGLAAWIVAAVFYLASPWLSPVALLLVTGPILSLFARRAVGVAVRAASPLLVALPGVLALPIALGFLLHGPTRELDSRAYGDMLYYVDKLVSAKQSLVPFHDLLVEGERIIYPEAAPSVIGAALADVPRFDVVLFHTTTLPAFLLASLALGLGLLGPTRGAAASRVLPVVALVAASLVVYPTWIVESPPVALSASLALAIYRLWEAPPATPWLAFVAVLCGAELLASKVVALTPLAVVVVVVLSQRYLRGAERGHAALVGAGLTAATALGIVFLLLTASWYTRLFAIGLLPADAARGLYGQLDTRSTQDLAPTFEILGQLLLLTAVIKARSVALAASLALSIAGVWLVSGQSFDAALGTSVLLAALLFWRQPEQLVRQQALVMASAATLVLSSWLRDISGIRAALALVVLLVVTLLAAFEGASRPPREALERLASPACIAVVAVLFALAGAPYAGLLVVVCLFVLSMLRRPALVTAALVASLGVSSVLVMRADDVRLGSGFVALTTEDYDIWRHVERLVPGGGLVFTSMTGRAIDGRHGWNNYPSIAGRQLYLAGWYDGRLVSDRAEVDRRLELNRKVLRGDLPPAGLDLDRSFGSYYAVLRRRERVPPSFALVYANPSFALYRLSR